MANKRHIPRAILLFAAAYTCFGVSALINNLLMIEGFMSQLTAATGQEMPRFVGVLVFGTRLVLRLGLIWFVVRRASQVARWLIIALTLPWLLQIPAAVEGLTAGDSVWLPWLVTFLFAVVAALCLFLRGARTWFARKGQSIAADHAIFN